MVDKENDDQNKAGLMLSGRMSEISEQQDGLSDAIRSMLQEDPLAVRRLATIQFDRIAWDSEYCKLRDADGEETLLEYRFIPLPKEVRQSLKQRGAQIPKNATMLELHVMAQEAGNDGIQMIRRIGKDVSTLRSFLSSLPPEQRPLFMGGTSYLADLSRRWGFDTVDIDPFARFTNPSARYLRDGMKSGFVPQGTLYEQEMLAAKKMAQRRKHHSMPIRLCMCSVSDFIHRPETRGKHVEGRLVDIRRQAKNAYIYLIEGPAQLASFAKEEWENWLEGRRVQRLDRYR